MVTRRGLFGAGAAALVVAGCGSTDEPEPVPAVVLNEQLRAARAAEAAYDGVADVDALRASAAARVRRIEAAVKSAGGTPALATPATPASGLPGALAAESAALRAHVAAVGQLKQPEWRELLAGLVAGTAASESALLGRLDRAPAPTAFPGQPLR